MADEELAAIRAKRLEELQTQYGVRFYSDYVFYHLDRDISFSFGNSRDRIQCKCSSKRRP